MAMRDDEETVELMEKRTKANADGHAAYVAGQPIEWNPYPPGILRDEWNDGWMDGADEDDV